MTGGKPSRKLPSNRPPGAAAFSKAKLRVFRWAAMVIVPLALLVLLEVVMEISGATYPTHFWIPCRGSPGVYQENEKFGWRFFPKTLARAPDPVRLSKPKPPGTYRIFVFGESAALGDPEPAYGFSRILRELLEARCPGTTFEIINTGITAINSHAILPLARDCVDFNGDLWILYMGNNEVVGPFGAGSVFGAKAPPLPIVRSDLALKRTALGQTVDRLWQNSAKHGRAPAQWEGMKMMLDQQIPMTDPVLQHVYRNFAGNLGDILSTAERAKAKCLVCSVSSNLRDCAPFASMNRADLTEDRKTSWNALLTNGEALEVRKDYGQALRAYEQASEIDDSASILAFRMARCHLALTNYVLARKEYERARDLDTLRFRADTEINRLIREACAAHLSGSVFFFDSEMVLTNACPSGIPGLECFWDHVHLNFSGNYRLARGLAEQVLQLLPGTLRPLPSATQFLSEEQCAQRLAYTEWDQRVVTAEMLRRIKEPPFTSQLGHAELVNLWSRRLVDLDQSLATSGFTKSLGTYREALKSRPDDWILQNRSAFLLEATGNLAEAAEQWKSVTEHVPECTEAWFKLGDICSQQSKPIEAELYFHRVLELRPASYEAMNSLGLLYMDQNKPEEAIRLFESALRANPKFAQAHVNWGVLEAHRGKPEAAEAQYREALKADADSVGAHVNLGNLLASQRKYSEAVEQYQQAIAVKPNDAALHFSLANSLAALGRGQEAVSQYGEAIRLNPNLAEARFNLGVALAKQGNLEEATGAFKEACRLNPDDPQARLSLGVALAKLGHMGEAVEQFQYVLRLDPQNAPARQYLRMAQSKARGP